MSPGFHRLMGAQGLAGLADNALLLVVMAMLIEQAGGAATNGHQRILDIQPSKLHERVAVILGSRAEVERVTAYHRS